MQVRALAVEPYLNRIAPAAVIADVKRLMKIGNEVDEELQSLLQLESRRAVLQNRYEIVYPADHAPGR